MGWLNKIFKGSSHKISEGQYHGKSGGDGIWNDPSGSVDAISEYDNEDIDHAIALSLSEEEHKKAKAIDNGSHLEEDEQLARALHESLNVDSPPRETRENRENSQSYNPVPYIFSSGFSHAWTRRNIYSEELHRWKNIH